MEQSQPLEETRIDTLSPLDRALSPSSSVPVRRRERGRRVALALVLVTSTCAMIASLLFLAGYLDVGLHDLLLLPWLLMLWSSLAGLLVLTGGSFVGGGALAFVLAHWLISPGKRGSVVSITPLSLGLSAENITFPSRHADRQVRGLFLPCLGAPTTIVVCPEDRRDTQEVLGMEVLSMCRQLWLAHHNVLVFAYHAPGSIMPPDYCDDFLGAVDYASQRAPDTRIGVLGYALGGAIALMGAARSQKVEAIVTDSAFATQWEMVEAMLHRRLPASASVPGWILRLLSTWLNAFMWRRGGYCLQQVEPVSDIAHIAPRPVLLIHGLKDTRVRPDDAYRLYQAAGRPKALWLLPDTKHLGACFSQGTGYVEHVTDFFARALTHTPSRALFAEIPGASALRFGSHDRSLTVTHQAWSRREGRNSDRLSFKATMDRARNVVVPLVVTMSLLVLFSVDLLPMLAQVQTAPLAFPLAPSSHSLRLSPSRGKQDEVVPPIGVIHAPLSRTDRR